MVHEYNVGTVVIHLKSHEINAYPLNKLETQSGMVKAKDADAGGWGYPQEDKFGIGSCLDLSDFTVFI